MGSSSVCAAIGYRVPEWVTADPEARPGTLVEEQVRSKGPAARPAGADLPAAPFNRAQRYPLLVVHDGTDYLQFAAMKTVLDNLIHRLDIDRSSRSSCRRANRLKEYPNHAPHARFIARELVPNAHRAAAPDRRPEARCPHGQLVRRRRLALERRVRYPGFFGSLLLQSASLVFTDIGFEHVGAVRASTRS